MKDIAVFGAGGFGREVACLIRIINESKEEPIWNFIGFFDDNADLKGKEISHFGKCLGGKDELNQWDKDLDIVLAIGSTTVVQNVYSLLNNEHLNYPNLIHPNFNIVDKDGFKIGNGNIIQGECTVSCDVTIGDFNVFNGSVVIGHDVIIGNNNIFMPAIRVSGGVTVGNGNFFGVGSIILQKLKIGNNIRLGAGSVMMTKPKDGNLYMGNPAKKVSYE